MFLSCHALWRSAHEWSAHDLHGSCSRAGSCSRRGGSFRVSQSNCAHSNCARSNRAHSIREMTIRQSCAHLSLNRNQPNCGRRRNRSIRRKSLPSATGTPAAGATTASGGMLCKSGYGKEKNCCNTKAGEPHKAPRTNRSFCRPGRGMPWLVSTLPSDKRVLRNRVKERSNRVKKCYAARISG